MVFTFSSMVDTQMGMILFVLESFADAAKYYNESLIHDSVASLKNRLVDSESINPLSILFKPEYHGDINDISENMIKQYYPEILSKSPTTDIFKLSQTSRIPGGANMSCFAFCKNLEEKQYINKIDPTYDVLLDEVDMQTYNGIFVRYPSELAKLKNLEGKHIYICNYRSNYKGDRFIDEFYKYARTNMLHTVDPYVGIKLLLPNGGIYK